MHPTTRPKTVLVAAAILSACACKAEPDPAGMPMPGDIAASDLSRDLSPATSTGKTAELIAGNRAFAVDLYHQLRTRERGNLVFSPHSISIALAMTYAGARANTATQMAKALRFSLSQDDLHPAFNWLDLELAKRGQGARGADGNGFRLNITSATFGQKGYPFVTSYLDVLALHHGAAIALLDFVQDPDGSRKQINAWVKNRTENRIPELLPVGGVDSLTRLVLTNAVYFNAAWEHVFATNATRVATFHAPSGDVSAEMMTGRGPFGYGAGAGYQAVSLPYDGKELDMVVILPDEGTFDAFESGLDAALLASILAAIAPSDILLTMPKFEYRTKADVKHGLRALGMTDAFDPNLSDFSGMDGGFRRDLYISDVFHEAFIKVTEHGTEATGATAVVVGIVSLPRSVVLDRPFLYVIRDIATGAILFLGRVVAPS